MESEYSAWLIVGYVLLCTILVGVLWRELWLRQLREKEWHWKLSKASHFEIKLLGSRHPYFEVDTLQGQLVEIGELLCLRDRCLDVGWALRRTDMCLNLKEAKNLLTLVTLVKADNPSLDSESLEKIRGEILTFVNHKGQEYQRAYQEQEEERILQSKLELNRSYNTRPILDVAPPNHQDNRL